MFNVLNSDLITYGKSLAASDISCRHKKCKKMLIAPTKSRNVANENLEIIVDPICTNFSKAPKIST